tara:strand:+ start:1753 stop:2169 length:417 start_codon:yes stop_codon:yes gene_type:complete
MSTDLDARQITLNYEGGSVEMSIGNAKDIFGPDFKGLDPGPKPTDVSVKSHTRTPVIGGPSKTISAYSYSYVQWPTSQASNAAAGEVILMTWDGSGGPFTARVTGSLAEAASFFSANVLKTLAFRSQRGTKYGPFPGI